MRKLILALIIIGLVMFGTTVSAGESPEGKPFQAIWDEITNIWNAITGLQEQIDEIPAGQSGQLGYRIVEKIHYRNVQGGNLGRGFISCDEGEIALSPGVASHDEYDRNWVYTLGEFFPLVKDGPNNENEYVLERFIEGLYRVDDQNNWYPYTMADLEPLYGTTWAYDVGKNCCVTNSRVYLTCLKMSS